MHILLVEDNVSLSQWLAKALERKGHVVDTLGEGEAALSLLCRQRFDAVILDIGLPGLSGREVLHTARARGCDTPVLVLTAEGSVQARIAGLDSGADDYLSKPFDLGELEARLRAIVRRELGRKNPELWCGTLRYDGNTRQFFVAEALLHLTPREHAVLEVLMLNLGKTVSKASLADSVFALGDDTGPTTIEVYASRLRKKLAACDARIFTLRGLGYLLKQATTPAAVPA